MHPLKVLFQGKRQPDSIPVRGHYAGAEKRIRRSTALQQEVGLPFDIIFAGSEIPHAHSIASPSAGDGERHSRIVARAHDIHILFFERDSAIICAPGTMPGSAARQRRSSLLLDDPAARKTFRRAAARGGRITFINTRTATSTQTPRRTLETIE
jgi:hypothetical protein